MAVFHYPGEPSGGWPLPNGIFLCSTTSSSGGVGQANPILLQYRGTRTIKPYRDAVVFQALGRSKPATEVGSYNFLSVDFSFAVPAQTTDYDGSSTVTGATIESRLLAINTALQAGNFVEYYDARGRHLVGVWTQDPQISDIEVGWRQISASLVEVG